MRRPHRRGVATLVVDESRPFRFGGGPRVMSEYAVMFQLGLPKAKRAMRLKASVVRQQVPLLLSRAVLKNMGAVVNLPGKCVCFKDIHVEMELVETSTGLCGFRVHVDFAEVGPEAPWLAMASNGLKVFIGKSKKQDSRTLGEAVCNMLFSPHFQEPREVWGPCERQFSQGLHSANCLLSSVACSEPIASKASV